MTEIKKILQDFTILFYHINDLLSVYLIFISLYIPIFLHNLYYIFYFFFKRNCDLQRNYIKMIIFV